MCHLGTRVAIYIHAGFWPLPPAKKMKQVISSTLRHFPPVDFVFAYGSGVFKQEGRELVILLRDALSDSAIVWRFQIFLLKIKSSYLQATSIYNVYTSAVSGFICPAKNGMLLILFICRGGFMSLVYPLISLQGKMIDLIFVVSDAQEWHTKNLSLNSSHYSFLR